MVDFWIVIVPKWLKYSRHLGVHGKLLINPTWLSTCLWEEKHHLKHMSLLVDCCPKEALFKSKCTLFYLYFHWPWTLCCPSSIPTQRKWYLLYGTSLAFTYMVLIKTPSDFQRLRLRVLRQKANEITKENKTHATTRYIDYESWGLLLKLCNIIKFFKDINL